MGDGRQIVEDSAPFLLRPEGHPNLDELFTFERAIDRPDERIRETPCADFADRLQIVPQHAEEVILFFRESHRSQFF